MARANLLLQTTGDAGEWSGEEVVVRRGLPEQTCLTSCFFSLFMLVDYFVLFIFCTYEDWILLRLSPKAYDGYMCIILQSLIFG